MPALVVNQQPLINFPRSYLRGIMLECNATSIVYVGNVLEFHNSSRTEDWHIEFFPNFHQWSSNVYSCDFCIDGDNSQASILGVPVFFGLFLSIQRNMFGVGNYLQIGVNLTFVDFTFISLPVAPPGYWIPPFPPE